MFRRAEPAGADVSVEIGNRPLYPGDAVDVEVVVTPHRALLVTEGVARLTSTEVLRVDSARDAIPQPMTARRRTRPYPKGPESISHTFAEQATLEADVVYRYPMRFRVPLSAPPTVKGKHARITWELAASVETRAEWMPGNEGLLGGLAHTRAGRDSQELVVFARPSASAIGGEMLPERPQVTREYRPAHLQMELDTGLVSNGGVVTGILTVQPQSSFGAREIRVELSRWERCGNKQARVVEARQLLQRPASLSAGETCQWPFRLRVPERLMPSVLAQHTFVGWQVSGVVVRGLRPNLKISQLIQVYTSP